MSTLQWHVLVPFHTPKCMTSPYYLIWDSQHKRNLATTTPWSIFRLLDALIDPFREWQIMSCLLKFQSSALVVPNHITPFRFKFVPHSVTSHNFWTISLSLIAVEQLSNITVPAFPWIKILLRLQQYDCAICLLCFFSLLLYSPPCSNV